MMGPDDLVYALIETGRSLLARGYAFGTAGNLSCRMGDRVFCTPTGSSLGSLRAQDIAVCHVDGTHVEGGKATKELPLHLAAYRARTDCQAVVHLHSCYATAVSCLKDLNTEDALPVLTPYYAMRIPGLPVIPFYPPGDERLGLELEKLAPHTPAMLMRNHGLVALGKTLAEASALAEEIEETARLFLLLGERAQALGSTDVANLRRRA
ncbi:MAG TPA: class II aldolase/adducin family protein [Terracidiphilus sp.]